MKNKNVQYLDNIKNSVNELLDFYTDNHRKTLSIRFDVRYPQDYTGDTSSKNISDCMAHMVKKYKRRKCDPYYIWVREQNKSDHPHYHCLFLLDGTRVKTYNHVFKSVETIWNSTLDIDRDSKGLIDYCTKKSNRDYNGKMITRTSDVEKFDSRLDEVKQQALYLAKAYTKGPLYDGQRNFGMSRLPKNKNRDSHNSDNN